MLGLGFGTSTACSMTRLAPLGTEGTAVTGTGVVGTALGCKVRVQMKVGLIARTGGVGLSLALARGVAVRVAVTLFVGV